MADYDFDIDAVQAEGWIKEVNIEIEAVEKILMNLSACISENPAKDDIVFSQIEDVGKNLNTAWNKTCVVFKDACNNISKGITSIQKHGQKMIDKVVSFKDKIKL